MTAFDTRTALFIVGMVYLLLPLFTWVVLLKDRPPQVAWWCGGGVILGISIVPLAFREQLPPEIGWPPFMLLFFCAHLMRVQALRIELGKAWPTKAVPIAAAALGLVSLWLQYGLHSTVLRVLFNSVVTATLLFYLAWLAWEVGRDNHRRNARWLTAYAVVALAYVYRFVAIVNGQKEIDVLSEGVSGQLIGATGLVTAIIGHFAYIGMALDRSRQRQLEYGPASTQTNLKY